jgi:hypothetical protein
MAVETYTNIDGIECVTWTDERGTHSMFKSAYDELKANEAKAI